MSVRSTFSIALIVVVVLLAIFAYGPNSLSLKKNYNLKKLVPISKSRDEANLNLYLSQPSINSINSSIARLAVRESKLEVPKDGAYLGVSSSMDELASLEDYTAKKNSVLHKYIYWGNNSSFDSFLAIKLLIDKKILIIAWNPSKSIINNPIDQPDYRLKTILTGKHDAYINKWVRDVKEWKRPVIIRFAPEMNGEWLPWGTLYSTPQEYIKTFRYVVDKFKKAKATNVSWMWSPNVAMKENLLEYYPGDKYVDWVGLSGFNWGGLESFNEWRTFEDIYDESLNQLKEVDKPIALAEFGSVESAAEPQEKGKWITSSFRSIKQKYPQIKMVNWSHGKSFGRYNWRADTSSYSLEAYKKAVADSYYLSTIKKVEL